MNTNEFKAFWENVRSTRCVPFTTETELRSYLDDLACEGCGKHCQPCRACDECAVFENKPAAHCEKICDDCFWCGCLQCSANWDYDGYMHPPQIDWRGRYNTAEVVVWNEMRTLPIDQLIKLFGKRFVMSQLPYTSNKEVWRTHFLDERQPMPCPSYVNYAKLSDDEKRLFEAPADSLRTYAANYNVIRIMTGLPGIRYSL